MEVAYATSAITNKRWQMQRCGDIQMLRLVHFKHKRSQRHNAEMTFGYPEVDMSAIIFIWNGRRVNR